MTSVQFQSLPHFHLVGLGSVSVVRAPCPVRSQVSQVSQ